jgi:hypothetical protein
VCPQKNNNLLFSQSIVISVPQLIIDPAWTFATAKRADRIKNTAANKRLIAIAPAFGCLCVHKGMIQHFRRKNKKTIAQTSGFSRVFLCSSLV